MTTTASVPTARQISSSSPNRAVRSASDVDEKAQSERVWKEIHSVLRNSQPDEPVTEWADASIDFRIGDSSPSLIRTVSAEDNMLRHVSRSSSTSSTSSAASAPVAVARRLHAGIERSPVASCKTNIPHADICLQFDQRSVGELVRACAAGDFARVLAAAARPRVGVCCVLAGSLDTPLHAAAADGQFVVVKWLVSAGADCNARNASGATPLHRCAVAASNVGDMALLLIGGGADPFVRNGSGLLAADLTTSIAIRALLLDAGRLPAVRFRVPRELISHIVGKGGERLQTLQQRTVTVIKLPPRDSQLDEILVRGLADGIQTVKEFLVNGIVTEGKSLINVHDVRMSTLPVARSSSPLMLIAEDLPPTIVHKRSSSVGHKPIVPSATVLNGSSIRSDSEPRSSRRVLVMASTVVKAQSSRRATDDGTSNSTSTSTAPAPVLQRRDVHDDSSVADDNAAKSSSSTKKKKKKKKKSKSSSSKIVKESESTATESSSQPASGRVSSPAESALSSALVTAPRTRSRGSDRSQTSLSYGSDRDISISRSGSDRSDRSDRSRAVSRSSSSSRIETR